MKPNTEKPDFIKVRALRDGYIGDGPSGMIYRYAGDVFTLQPRHVSDVLTISPERQFSKIWMERVADDEPEKLTTAKAGLKRESEDLRGSPAEE